MSLTPEQTARAIKVLPKIIDTLKAANDLFEDEEESVREEHAEFIVELEALMRHISRGDPL